MIIFLWPGLFFSISQSSLGSECALEQLPFTSRYSASGERFLAIEFQDRKLVAVGGIEKEDGIHPLIVVSTNGWDFEKHIFDPTNNSFNRIFFAGKIWIATTWASTAIAVSSDGKDWVFGDSGATRGLESVAFGNGKFLAGTIETDGFFGSSTDGGHWDSFSSPTNTIPAAVGFFRDRFIAAGWLQRYDLYPGFIINSSDALNWSDLTDASPVYFYRLTMTPARAFAVGFTMGSPSVRGTNQVYVSTDAINWHQFGPGLPDETAFTDFKYLNGRLVGVRNNNELDYFSERFNEWSRVSFTVDFHGITHAFHSYFLAGRGISASSSTLPPCLESLGSGGGDFLFNFQGEADANYRLEISSDLQTWTTWKDFVADAADLQFRYPTDSTRTVYFRARAIDP